MTREIHPLRKILDELDDFDPVDELEDLEFKLDVLASAIIKFSGAEQTLSVPLDGLLALINEDINSDLLAEASTDAEYLMGATSIAGYGMTDFSDEVNSRIKEKMDRLVHNLSCAFDVKDDPK